MKSRSSNAAKTLQAIENKLPLLFQFLGHDDDDISLAITGFAHDYIGVLKQVSLWALKWGNDPKQKICMFCALSQNYWHLLKNNICI